MSGSQTVPQFTLRVIQGDSFLQQFIWKDSDGNPIDLTGYTAQLQIRQDVANNTVLITLTELSGITLGGVLGTIDVAMTPAQTVLDKLKNNPGVYDLELTSPASVVSTIIGGQVVLTLEVTR